MGGTVTLRTEGSPYTVGVASDAAGIREAQQLRWRVFVGELGATIDAAEPGVDADRWDPYCDHLVVREAASERVIGTYRLLPAARAREAGGFYSASEFVLDGLGALEPHVVEVGRACVAPEHRNGVVVALLWAGVLRYAQDAGHAHLIGCASIELSHGPPAVAALCRRLCREQSGAAMLHATPRRPFPLDGPPSEREAPLPPLLKGYLRLGAQVCGDPAWDPEFGTADLLVHLPLDRLSRRHAHRLRRAA